MIKIRIFQGGSEFRLTANEIDPDIPKNKFIGEIIHEIFSADSKYRRNGSKLINYRDYFDLLIIDKDKTLLDTRQEKYDFIRSRIHFNSKAKSKRKFAGIIFQLLNRVDVQISSSTANTHHKNALIEFIEEDIDEDINKIVSFRDQEIKSIFTDIQAINICGGINSSKARRIKNNYYETFRLTEEEIFLAHQHAMACYEKYGLSHLKYCLTLPPLPFKFSNVERLFSFFDKNKSENPKFRIVTEDKQEILLFIDKRTRSIKATCPKGENILQIERNGNVSQMNSNKISKPTLELFVRTIENPGFQIIHFGYTTGYCSFCNSKLTDPSSLEHGYGKQCAKNNNLNWG